MCDVVYNCNVYLYTQHYVKIKCQMKLHLKCKLRILFNHTSNKKISLYNNNSLPATTHTVRTCSIKSITILIIKIRLRVEPVNNKKIIVCMNVY